MLSGEDPMSVNIQINILFWVYFSLYIRKPFIVLSLFLLQTSANRKQVENMAKKRLDSLMKESKIRDREDPDSFTIAALPPAGKVAHKTSSKVKYIRIRHSSNRSFKTYLITFTCGLKCLHKFSQNWCLFSAGSSITLLILLKIHGCLCHSNKQIFLPFMMSVLGFAFINPKLPYYT